MAIIELTKDNFEQEALKAQEPVLIDFWAPWCGPCRVLSPVVDEIAEEVVGIKVCKVNVDEQPEVAAKYRVMSIPTLVLLKGGEVVNTMVGVHSKQDIVDMIQ